MTATEPTTLPPPVPFTLGDSHARADRRCEWLPGLLRVSWRRKGKNGPTGSPVVAYYAVREFKPEWSGRAFVVAKFGGASHRVYVGADGSRSCDCAAGSYDPTAKANRRAVEAGGDAVAGAGCVHQDCILVLVEKGLV